MSQFDDTLKSIDHEILFVRRGERSGLYTLVAVHSTALGPSLGGCRLWPYPDVRYAISDVLRLAQAMTLKSSVANLPLGGGKGVIMLPEGSKPPTGDLRRAALLDFGDTVEMLGGRYITAEDVGISDTDLITIAERTPHVTGLGIDHGGSGDPSPWTAKGVAAGIRMSCEHVWGTDSLAGRTIAIVGVGHVGSKLAAILAREGAKLTLADIDEGKKSIADELGAEWTTPESAMRLEVDVIAPCALGAVLNEESVPQLKCKVVAGAANNQLQSDATGDHLVQRGIFWAPDFVINAGGIINISAEFEPGGYSEQRAEVLVNGIAKTLGTIFKDADHSNITPLAAAIKLAHKRLDAAEQERALSAV